VRTVKTRSIYTSSPVLKMRQRRRRIWEI